MQYIHNFVNILHKNKVFAGPVTVHASIAPHGQHRRMRRNPMWKRNMLPQGRSVTAPTYAVVDFRLSV